MELGGWMLGQMELAHGIPAPSGRVLSRDRAPVAPVRWLGRSCGGNHRLGTIVTGPLSLPCDVVVIQCIGLFGEILFPTNCDILCEMNVLELIKRIPRLNR